MLSDLEEVLERSIFHAIRETVVAEGYLPQINDFDVEDTDVLVAENQKVEYQEAKTSIFNSKGFVIDIFGPGNAQSRGYKKVPRIVIDSVSFQPGELGGDTTPVYELIGGVYVKTKNQSVASDFYYNIYIVSNSIAQQRILNAVVARALPRRGYIKTYLNQTIQFDGNLLVKYLLSGDTPDLPEGILEKFFSYVTPDVFEGLPEIVSTTVGGNPFELKPMTEQELTTDFLIN